MIFVSLIDNNFFVLFLIALSVILSVAYTMWFYNKIIFGNVKINFIQNWVDLDKKNNLIYALLCVLTLFFGLFPNQIFDVTNVSSFYITELMRFKTIVFY
jgi:NADH-quinone oxidoreductase subunit M